MLATVRVQRRGDPVPGLSHVFKHNPVIGQLGAFCQVAALLRFRACFIGRRWDSIVAPVACRRERGRVSQSPTPEKLVGDGNTLKQIAGQRNPRN